MQLAPCARPSRPVTTASQCDTHLRRLQIAQFSILIPGAIIKDNMKLKKLPKLIFLKTGNPNVTVLGNPMLDTTDLRNYCEQVQCRDSVMARIQMPFRKSPPSQFQGAFSMEGVLTTIMEPNYLVHRQCITSIYHSQWCRARRLQHNEKSTQGVSKKMFSQF